MYLIIFFFVLIIVLMYYVLFMDTLSKNKVRDLTNDWIYDVTVRHDADAVANRFADDGSLLATVSPNYRQGCDILEYFKFFVNVPGIQVLQRQYNISKVSNGVWLNSAFVTWKWDGLDDNGLVARMSFLYRNNKIFQLHSSLSPEGHPDLYPPQYHPEDPEVVL
jgi:hypothetical protein